MARVTRSHSHGGNRGLGMLVVVFLGILVLTFLLGVLVGRRSVRSSQREVAAEKEKRLVQPKGGGLRDRELERLPQVQEKLTFYHTLTAPLGSKPPVPKTPTARDGSAPPEPEHRTSGTAAAAADLPAGDTVKPAEGPSADQSWTVQVGAYRSREVALALQRSLTASGYEAYVGEVVGQDGAVRYRVRVGQYQSRSDAERVLQRLKSTQALSPLVVPR